MKKVLSVAMASAMVLGMGANAFAIEYSTGSNDKASWPKGFAFEGSLFVTNADDEIVKESTTAINKKQNVNFEPGDVIWMPLYADNQKLYTVQNNQKGESEVAAQTKTFNGVNATDADAGVVINAAGKWQNFYYVDVTNEVVYYTNEAGRGGVPAVPAQYSGFRTQLIPASSVSVYKDGLATTEGTHLVETTPGYTKNEQIAKEVTVALTGGKTFGTIADTDTKTEVKGVVSKSGLAVADKNAVARTFKLTIAEAYAEALFTAPLGHTYAAESTQDIIVTFDENNASSGLANVVLTDSYAVASSTGVKSGVTVRVNLPKVEGKNENLGEIVDVNGKNIVETVVAHGHYTGNIDKNWSINLIEKDGTVADLVEKAELYKADEADYLSYKGVTNEIQPNAVYLKVTLKDEWKTTKSETLKYYVYVADNKSEKADNKTNEVWVSGTYENTDFEYVNFDWSNDASRAKLWKVRKDESGKAVFDFADKAFFTVKMYGGESMYLDLATAYDKVIAGEMDVEADSFYKFEGSNANFARSGELVIVTNDDTLVPYEIDEDGNFVELDAEFVKDYKIAHTNAKVNGFKFDTKQLGNYVLSTEELGAEDEEVPEVDEEPVPEVEEEPAPETNKPNPETGAEDFVGLAVSLAVVSVAAAGALALKK